MGRKNNRKKIRQKGYHTGLPDVVTHAQKDVTEKPHRIEPPPLAIQNENTYCFDFPSLTSNRSEMDELPKSRTSTGKKTIVIVDYEHWFYSMWTKFGIRPNIEELYSVVEQDSVLDFRVYADFSKDDIAKELMRIRSFAPTVLDTRSPNKKSEKDFTDFIILNDLYRLCLQDNKIEKVVLMTGDGHFSPAVSFLKLSCGIEVDVCGVRGCIHTALRLVASSLHELPMSMDYLRPCAKDIFVYMRKVYSKASWYSFNFLSLADNISKTHGYSLQIVKDTIETMLRQGYLSREVRFVKGQEKNVLEVNWIKVEKDGLTVEPFASGL